MNSADHESQTYRAPNGKYYAIWRGRPVCALPGVLVYFETERDAEEFLIRCDTEDRVDGLRLPQSSLVSVISSPVPLGVRCITVRLFIMIQYTLCRPRRGLSKGEHDAKNDRDRSTRDTRNFVGRVEAGFRRHGK